ncbi:MAG: NAD-dependent protein deacetylase [Pseudomonadota bacterium]
MWRTYTREYASDQLSVFGPQYLQVLAVRTRKIPAQKSSLISGAETAEILREHSPFLVVSGAGISAGSGIPTYRDATGAWMRSKPITHQEFTGEEIFRKRYWGRSLLGWPAVRDARPSSAHRCLAILEGRGHVNTVVTQNVDRLHQRAGSSKVIDLHGRLDRVHCLNCGASLQREQMQLRLERLNPQIQQQHNTARPDGDADLANRMVDTVSIPPCDRCGGVLMPDVVFFGGSIPSAVTNAAKVALNESEALVVVGSSLQVYSGYRFCRWASSAGKPIILLNPGSTRADDLAQRWPVDADSGLAELLQSLSAAPISTGAVF